MVKRFWYRFFYSFPIQLLLLHFRKYQVLLIFWAILFSTINGGFAKTFGGDALFLAPEYMGKVNFYSTTLTGVATAIFTMSWNITTFILHSGRFKFLATTSQPFSRYCLNNSIIPAAFLLMLLWRGWQYQRWQELNSVPQILLPSPVRYLGLLGPRKRTDSLLADLKEKGFQPSPEQLARLYAPVGLDIGSEGPAEVAMSILAEMQAVLTEHDGGHLRARKQPIHQRRDGTSQPSMHDRRAERV